jgi:hypothetical protein
VVTPDSWPFEFPVDVEELAAAADAAARLPAIRAAFALKWRFKNGS